MNLKSIVSEVSRRQASSVVEETKRKSDSAASDCCLNVNMSNGYVNLFSDASAVYVYTVGAESLHVSYVCAANGTSVAASPPRRVLNVDISRLVVFQSTRTRHHHQHQQSSAFAGNNNLMRANKSVIDQINQMNWINSVLERRRGAGAYFAHFWGTLLRVDSIKCSHSRLTRLTVHSLFVEHLPHHHHHHHKQLAQLVPAALDWLVRTRQRFDSLFQQPSRVN